MKVILKLPQAKEQKPEEEEEVAGRSICLRSPTYDLPESLTAFSSCNMCCTSLVLCVIIFFVVEKWMSIILQPWKSDSLPLQGLLLLLLLA